MSCPPPDHESYNKSQSGDELGLPLESRITRSEHADSNLEHQLPASNPEIPSQPATSSRIDYPMSLASGLYTVVTLLGKSSERKIYLAHDSNLSREVVITLLKTREPKVAAISELITREVQLLRKTSHPNIVTIVDTGNHEGELFVVTEFMENGSLEALLDRIPNHRLPIEKTIKLTVSICRGLESAHSKGIVHRDLRSSKILLSSDSNAKMSDFGIAMAVDVSRLTLEGETARYAFYISPEQAKGEEITPLSNLYSLGAILYEMVTGRPPFTGDSSVIVITQHINESPPVTPAWYCPDIPPAFETLIMQLLEKDPGERPSSVLDVLREIESIEIERTEKPSVESVSLTGSPLYHHVFVGRENELKQLKYAFNSAISGSGSLVMIAGEAGIGKTALCEQLSTYATLYGGKTLVGHCYEQGSMTLPYLAFVEAIRSYILSSDIARLKEEMGSSATIIASIITEITDRLGTKPERGGNLELQRYRLMRSVTNFLTNATKTQPLLVLLEDLHYADRGTLDMLAYIGRNLEETNLLIVGTYRNVEVDRTHPLSAVLADLHHSSAYERILLKGLNADEVRRMMNAISGQEVRRSTVEAAFNQTEGNPLFVQELIRYLAESGIVTRQQGKWRQSGKASLEMSIPEGLRDVIGKRLSSLSDSCNRVLSIASVIGREFSLEILHKVAVISEDDMFKALDEARRAAVIEERSAIGGGVIYRFAHAFFRQTMYEEIIAPRRIRLHQQVARTLEEVFLANLNEHAAELAEHFSYSSDEKELGKSVIYGEMAAQHAMSVYSFGEAARLLERAIRVEDIVAPDDRAKRYDLLLALAKTLIMAGEPDRALDVELPEAFSLAEAMGDRKRASRVCESAFNALYQQGQMVAYSTPTATLWAERADQYAEPETIGRAWADTILGVVKSSTGSYAEGFQFINQALEQSRKLNDPELFSCAASWWFMWGMAPWQEQEVLKLVDDLVIAASGSVSLVSARIGLSMAGYFSLVCGRRERAEEIFHSVKELANRTGQSHCVIVSMIQESILLYLDGLLEDSWEMTQRAMEHSHEAGLYDFTRSLIGYMLTRVPIYLGKVQTYFEDTIECMTETTARFTSQRALRLFCLVCLGRNSEVVEELDQMLAKRPGIVDGPEVWWHIAYLEIATLVEHREAVSLLLPRFAHSNLCLTARPSFICASRIFGDAAAFLGKHEEARIHYQKAVTIATEMRFRPELGLTRFQLAQLYLGHYPEKRTEALEHLDFAIDEFREMSMQPSLERALKDRNMLRDHQKFFKLQVNESSEDKTTITRNKAMEERLTEVAQPTKIPLRVCCLGLLSVNSPLGPVQHWPSKRAKAVFEYLIAKPGVPISRDILMESLWPGHDSDSAANNLRLAIHSLRQTLNELVGNPKNFTSILRSQQGYYLNPVIELTVDSEQFEHLYREGNRLAQADKTEEAIGKFRDAVELYQGDYLEDEVYLDWTSTRREAFKDTYLLMLDKLTDYYLGNKDYEFCIGYCQKIITRDPYRENIYRKLMSCFSRIGQRNRALQWYENCCKALQSGMDTVPDQKTTSLYDCLIRGEEI